MKTLHHTGAVIGGMVAGGVAMTAIQWINSQFYKMPEGLDTNNLAAMTQWINSFPILALLIVLTSEACGFFTGTFVARRLAPDRSLTPSLVVWAFFAVGTVINLSLIPHPIGFAVSSALGWAVFGFVGMITAGPKAYIVHSTRSIDAPIELVFKTLATVERFQKVVPSITKIKFLSEQKYGVGTRFLETRLLNGKEATTELEVIQLVESQHIRIVSDMGGTLWDTTFQVEINGDRVKMNVQMDAKPHSLMAHFVTPMIISMVDNFVQQDMDAVKAYCELPSSQHAEAETD